MQAQRKRARSLPLGSMTIALWVGVCALVAGACGDTANPGAGAGGNPDTAGAAGEASGAAASGATSPGGEASGGGGGSDETPVAGAPNGGSGGSAQAGSSTGGSTAGTGGSANPLCTQVDNDGFFATCDACGPDCDTIDTNAGSRKACGCGSGCPCGLSCGCYEIGPNISVCDICVR